MLDLLLDITQNPLPVQTAINMTQVGGAINQIDMADTAYPNRNAEVQIILTAGWPKRCPLIFGRQEAI